MSEPRYDLLLKGGQVIDPRNHIRDRLDLAISDGKIARLAPRIDADRAAKVVDVSDHYVVPGLIDLHAHVYHTREPEGLSVMADAHSFRSGVTTIVDAGTSGGQNFLHFKETVVDLARTRILAFVNIVGLGMEGDFEQDVRQMDPQLAASTVLTFPDVAVGIKTAHYWTKQRWDEAHPPWVAVERAVQGGEICQKPVMVDFWPRPPQRSYRNLLLHQLRPGDIHTHMYAQQFPILDDESKPNDFLFQARERGIIFDLGHGAASFWFRNAVPAMEQGFGPDSISTDLHTGNVNGPVVDLLTTMSKLLNIGMSLEEVIMRTTVTPAQEIERPELGTLSPGAEADVAVLKMLRGSFGYADCGKTRMTGTRKLSCAMTIRAGAIVYDPTGLSMPAWTDA
jgi:dihydroorotase